jgi:hypothetical protein
MSYSTYRQRRYVHAASRLDLAPGPEGRPEFRDVGGGQTPGTSNSMWRGGGVPIRSESIDEGGRAPPGSARGE